MSAQYPVAMLCEVLEVARSSYYAWQERVPGKRAQQDLILVVKLVQLHAASRRTYGSPRLRLDLQEQGLAVGRRRIMRLMKQACIRGQYRRRWRPSTTDSNHSHRIAPHLLAQHAVPTRCDEVWLTDMTYVWTLEGWLYVAGVLDAYSRRLIGWAFAARPTAALCVCALRMAVQTRHPRLGLVHHSDRGVQYASDEYRAALDQIGATPSMSRRANCYDNATMESFWSTLKGDCLEHLRFATRRQAQLAIFDYIETFYNRSRRHSSLGYTSPVAFEHNQN
jgi:putative transposase